MSGNSHQRRKRCRAILRILHKMRENGDTMIVCKPRAMGKSELHRNIIEDLRKVPGVRMQVAKATDREYVPLTRSKLDEYIKEMFMNSGMDNPEQRAANMSAWIHKEGGNHE